MTTPEAGSGEAAAKARSRRIFAAIGGLTAVGFMIGFVLALVERDGAPMLSGNTVSPTLAIGAAIVMVVAVSWGCWRFYRSVDELERLDNALAGAVGANVLLGGYPIWLLLWKGGVAPEPNHFAMFAVVFAAALITYAWRKLR
jgi:hypothetical protein